MGKASIRNGPGLAITIGVLVTTASSFNPSPTLISCFRPHSVRIPRTSFTARDIGGGVCSWNLNMSEEGSPISSPPQPVKPSETEERKLPMLLDIGTKGGASFLSLVLFIVPLIAYNVIVSTTGMDGEDVGRWIGVGFTVLTLIGWSSTYILRVATKDMTYAKQLKEYENAVIAKRLEELEDDEVLALVEEMERDTF
uniref:Uncharacterized protein n=2 Tax=Corethron hystrix TaxID=216773 RepID=A0A7S1FWZ2_9STRA|mmetsp:Transcript_35015/g.80958  ORF Transcript_35015/g.80958 Transcript_35015/m.80958 type:complete len:197 (+) Transcript_35015:288-878(+)